jgi:hypothetical protein
MLPEILLGPKMRYLDRYKYLIFGPKIFLKNLLAAFGAVNPHSMLHGELVIPPLG